jgi:hypothetical protein
MDESNVFFRGVTSMTRKMIAVLVLVSFLACAALAQAEVKEGLWEMKTTIEMPGMPMKIPPTTTQTCISKDDMVPKPQAQRGQQQDCKMTEQKLVGNTVTYAMKCTDKKGMTAEMSGKMVYSGDTMEGSYTIKTSGASAMEMSAKMTGKYIGKCAK